MDLDANGYSVVLSGIGILINNNKSINFYTNRLKNKVEVITEDLKGSKYKSIFKIEDVHYRRIKKKEIGK